MDGLVERPLSPSLDELRALPSRTQITRHDCVEGWRVIGKWKGAKFCALLESAGPLPAARYVMFYCADAMNARGRPYYESIDMNDAYHPQTLLAYELNDRPVPVANGAPVRMRIELVESFDHIHGGNGSYWAIEATNGTLGSDWLTPHTSNEATSTVCERNETAVPRHTCAAASTRRPGAYTRPLK